METHTRQTGPVAHILLIGELTGGESEEVLLKEVDSATESGSVYIALDMSRLTYINSVGLGSLIRVYKRVADKGGDICIANAQPHIRQVLSHFGRVPFFSAKASDKIREWTGKSESDGTDA